MRVQRIGFVGPRAADAPATEAWFFVTAPDGNVYCIEQTPD